MARNDQTTVCIPQDTKRRIRIMAANWGLPMGKAALLLIQAGLNEYQKQSLADPSYAMPGAGPVMDAQA